MWASERENALCCNLALDSELNAANVELFQGTIGIDCYGGVQFSYEVNAGIEVVAGKPSEPGLFKKSSSWKWRHL
jgi:hypothetical protein